MKEKYRTKGICAREVDFEIVDGLLKNVSFQAGCNGNLQGLSILLEGMRAEEAAKKLKGIRCGLKSTSCPDQLATAIESVLKRENNLDGI